MKELYEYFIKLPIFSALARTYFVRKRRKLRKKISSFSSSICHKNCAPTFIWCTSCPCVWIDFISCWFIKQKSGQRGRSGNDARKMVECNLYDVYTNDMRKNFLSLIQFTCKKVSNRFASLFLSFFYDSFYSFFSFLANFFPLGVKIDF